MFRNTHIPTDSKTNELVALHSLVVTNTYPGPAAKVQEPTPAVGPGVRGHGNSQRALVLSISKVFVATLDLFLRGVAGFKLVLGHSVILKSEIFCNYNPWSFMITAPLLFLKITTISGHSLFPRIN